MGEYGWSLGTMLLGAALNTFLFGVVTHQYILYYTAKFNDSLWVRATVHTLLAIDISHSAIIVYNVWFYLVVNYNNPSNVNIPFWAYLITPVMETFSAVLTQNFLARRLYRLNERRSIYIILMVLISLNLTLGLASSLNYFLVTEMTWVNVVKAQYLYVPWIIQAMTDAIISSSLAREFNSFRTGSSKSDQVLSILVRKAIQSGLFATIFTVCAALVLLLAQESTGHLCGMFVVPLGRVYTNALMDTLLIRTNFREVFSASENLTDIVARDLQHFGSDPPSSDSKLSDPSINSVYTEDSNTVV